jgi:hypothetical protein
MGVLVAALSVDLRLARDRVIELPLDVGSRPIRQNADEDGET